MKQLNKLSEKVLTYQYLLYRWIGYTKLDTKFSMKGGLLNIC